MANVRRQLGVTIICVLAALLAGCPVPSAIHYFNGTDDVITVYGRSGSFEWQPRSELRVNPSTRFEQAVAGRELPERLKLEVGPKDTFGLLVIERGGKKARYPLAHGKLRLPAGYVVGTGLREIFLQLEPDGRLYAVKPEQLGTQAPPGAPISPYWIEPLD